MSDLPNTDTDINETTDLGHGPGVLAAFGVHGWRAIETPLLAGIMLGEPICLISDPGMAKTFTAQILAKALQMPFGYYSADKVGFEDLAGFPNPQALKDGKIETIKTPLTIWDKEIVLIDEISRIARGMENRWLEILGSRMCLGQPLPIKAVIGAMNPLSSAGTQPLGEAFADRFLAFVPVPSMASFEDETRYDIIASESTGEAPSIDFWAGKAPADKSKEIATFLAAADQLKALLKEAAIAYRVFQQTDAYKSLVDYVDLFAKVIMRGANIKLEARRLKMMKRFLAGCIVMRETELGRDLHETELHALVRYCVAMTLTQQVTGMELSGTAIFAAHEEAASALRHDRSSYMLFTSLSKADKLAQLFEAEFDPAVVQKICADFTMDDTREADLVSLAIAPLLIQANIIDQLPVDCLAKLAERVMTTKALTTASIALKITPASARAKVREIEQLKVIVDNSKTNSERLLLSIVFARSCDKYNKVNPKAFCENYEELKPIWENTLNRFKPLWEKYCA